MVQVVALALGGLAGLLALIGGFGLTRVWAHKFGLVADGTVVSLVPSTTILLRDGAVIDSTQDAADMLDLKSLAGLHWDALRDQLLFRFPDFPEIPPGTALDVPANDCPETYLSLEPSDGVLRLVLHAATMGPGLQHRMAQRASFAAQLKEIANAAPYPIWHMSRQNEVLWCNAAYTRLIGQNLNGPYAGCPFNLAPDPLRPSARVHLSKDKPGSKDNWYEVTSCEVEDGWAHFAICIDSLVDAEVAQRNFVQTLTKTFAHLPIGLAVFDRDRRLVLFNPALVDLTNLKVDFLSARPNLLSFFDHMRDNRMMPEPKNYASWREQMAALISAARDDRYSETWNLPSGLTYKITGRPHPDGAVAFLIEDISAEISLTRRFRSELELTQSVIDSFDCAVAVFSQLGVLTFCNASYRSMWKCDPDSAFAEVTVFDASRDWQQACNPSPIWGELREFVMVKRERATWDTLLELKTGDKLTCSVEPIAAGSTMVRFSRVRTEVTKKPAVTVSLN